MPSFLPKIPRDMAGWEIKDWGQRIEDAAGRNSDADGDINAGGEVELLQLIDRASCRIDDIEKALVCADFELFGRLFIDVDRAIEAMIKAGTEQATTADFPDAVDTLPVEEAEADVMEDKPSVRAAVKKKARMRPRGSVKRIRTERKG